MNAETRAELKPARKTGRPRPRSSLAVMLLVAGFVGALLYFAHAVFVPIALAVLFALLLSGPVEVLHRKKLPRTLGAALILLMFLSVAGVTVDLLWDPAQQWLAAAPRTASVIRGTARNASGSDLTSAAKHS